MAIIVKERYSISDAMRHREPREYAMTIIRAAKIAKFGDVHNQLDTIWNGLDMEFQSDIDPPTTQTTLNQFLASMDVRKTQWWTKASRMGKQQNSQHVPQRANNPSNRGNASQYNNQRMPLRPMNSGFQNSQNSGFRSMDRQQGSASPYQNFQAYNQQNRQPAYQSNVPAYQSYPRRDAQQALPAPSVQRQITAGPNSSSQQNAYGSRQPFQPRSTGSSYQASNRPSYQPGRPPYQAASNQGPYPQRAYQASVESEEFPEHQSEQDPNYDSFYNEYQDLPENENSEDYSSFHDSGTTEPEVNFVDSAPLSKHSCQLCQQTFGSRNKLFQHLKQKCWKKETSPEAHSTEAHSTEAHSTEAHSTEAHSTEVPPEALATETPPRIIESATGTSPSQGLGTAFRGFQHTKADVRFSPDGQDHEVCLDPGCPITLGDRALLAAGIPDFEKRVQRQASPIPVRGYDNKITNATEYILMDLYFPGILGSTEEAALAKVRMEVHLTDNLKANMLIGTDVLTPHQFLLDCASQS